ncbi:MAG: ABC transporter permease [Candidatus Sulfopaludibacter sp.]|nr:ABC transporter permease [Candidatus Sulfopaludibacter sp.]
MRKLVCRIHALMHRRKIERQLADEMAAHREMMPADRRRNFGSTLRIQEEAADQWGWTWLDHFRQDVLYGARALRRSPGFALTAIAVLSLGIGVNLAELQVFHALIHRLNVRDVDSLCQFRRITRSGTMFGVSFPAVEFYERQNTVLSAVIAETYVPGVFQADDSEALRCNLVSGNFFSELGIMPMYGRMLDERDNQPGARPVAVLGYGYWQSRFGGDPRIVQKDIRLNGKPVQVVGIAPQQFGGLVQQPATLWMPVRQYPYLTGDAGMLADANVQRVFLIGRLKAGVSFRVAEEHFRALTAEWRNRHPKSVEAGEWLQVQPADAPPNMKPQVVVLIGICVLMTLLVLLSACANLGNMLLARGLARQREMEIRLAIGAGRWRLIRQLMTESLLLAVLASGAALLVGKLAAQLLLHIIDAPFLRITTDWKVALACAALGLGSTVAFGLAPAFQAVKRGPRATRARKILVAVQVSVSCVLLILSGFFTRAAQYSYSNQVTFDVAGTMVVDPQLYLHNYTVAQSRQAAQEMAARVMRLPGIDAVSFATMPPFSRSQIEHVSGQALYLNEVDPAFFPMMRLPLLDGHIFGPDEPDAVVVSESAARRLWPDASPLGKTCLIAKRIRTVTGVVKDSRVNQWSNPESVEVYLPVDDQNSVYATILIHAKGSGPAPGAVRTAATLPRLTPAVHTLQRAIDAQRDTMVKTVEVVSSLGAIASLLAMLGIFGLLAFTVAQRTREIGVRMALGADGRDVLQCVLGQYMLPFGGGAAAGTAIAFTAAKVLRKFLFGFIPFNLAGFGVGLLLFVAVAIAASIVPVRRALRIDPASALRYE